MPNAPYTSSILDKHANCIGGKALNQRPRAIGRWF